MFMRSLLRGILIENQYAVYEACNGQEAIYQYSLHKPDVVIMDISMPVMDGISATRAIKEINPHAVIVMCSGTRHKSMIIDSVQAGASDFVTKPFRSDRIVSCIKKHAA